MVKLRIEGEGATGSGYRLFLDDEEISNSCRSVNLDMSVEDANVAVIEVYVDRVDLSADVEARLEFVDGPERTSFASRFRELLGV